MDQTRKVPRVILLLVPILFHLQGITALEEDFRFCATRNQTRKSFVYYRKQGNTISIVNHADSLYISTPFPPDSRNYSLQDRSGPYRFCVFGHQGTRVLTLHYGNVSFNLSTEARGFLCSSNVSGKPRQDGTSVLRSVSYAYNKGSHNNSLPDSAAYVFSFHDHGTADQKRSVQVCEVENQLGDIAIALKNTKHGRRTSFRNMYKDLHQLDINLGEMDFKEERRTLKKGPIRASVWKVLPHKASQDIAIQSKLEEDKEISGFDVTLPSILFPTSRGRAMSSPKVVLMEISSRTFFQPDQNSSWLLGGKVFGISVANRSVSGLPKEQRVALTFWHSLLPKNASPQCVFWDTSADAGRTGFWNRFGSEVKAGRNRTTCLWDHLTFFAVLMTSSSGINHVDKENLTMITYFGCIVSALASLFTVCFFLCSGKRERGNIVHIHMNLLWAIFLLDVSFLIAVPLSSVDNPAACKAGAMFLHFALLACLSWMGIEGYSLYQRVIEVFNSSAGNFLLKMCLVGWGLPIFLVTVIFASDPSSYGPYSIKVYETSDRYTYATICWITTHISGILNLGFLSLVILFNSIMLAAMVRVILKLKQPDHHRWQYAVMLLGLSCVLGIPWGLAFFAFTFGNFKLAAIYLFTIINSLQGFLIFLWYLAKMVQSRRSASATSMSYKSVKAHSSSSSSSML